MKLQPIALLVGFRVFENSMASFLPRFLDVVVVAAPNICLISGLISMSAICSSMFDSSVQYSDLFTTRTVTWISETLVTHALLNSFRTDHWVRLKHEFSCFWNRYHHFRFFI